MENTARIIDFEEAKKIETIEKYQQITAELSSMKKEADALKRQLMDWIPERDKMTAGDYTVIHKVTESTQLDTAAIKDILPELWQEYGKITESHSIVIA